MVRLVFILAAATLGLMALGSATRVMNAGLSCPDWPLCYGEFLPRDRMNLQVFLEWFHRLVASVIGVSTIGCLGLSFWWRQYLPRWLPWLAGTALGLVILQGILGGLTVTELLRFDIVTAHLSTGLAFFCVLLVTGSLLLEMQPTGTAGKLGWFSLIAALLVYGQSLLGGLVASQWAVHQCFGMTQLCGVMNRHIFGVFPTTIAILGVLLWVWRVPGLHPWLRRLALAIAGLLGGQIALGVTTLHLRLQVELLTVLHQAVGAALLGTLVGFTVLALRDRRPLIPHQSGEATLG
jgi:cytochrome c oxidase assembly protein subunit 15